MIILFADILVGLGGIETYLDALARTLHAEGRRFRIAVSLNAPAPFLDDLEALGVEVYRQPRAPGDRFRVRQRLLVHHVANRLQPGDWVYCVRQPMAGVYLPLVRAAHRKGAKVAASWIFTPEFLPPPPGRAGERFCKAIAETDVVISVSHAGVPRYREIYGYRGGVKVVRYHNRILFGSVVPMPTAPPYAIGFMGRIDIHQKNLDTILGAFGALRAKRQDVILNIYGGGPDETRFAAMVDAAGLGEAVRVHGRYQHDRDLHRIIGDNHIFIYTSRFEGGPCFSLLELMQGGRYVVTSPVGGIPDIYEGRPDLGLLVASNCAEAIAEALEGALARIENGAVDVALIRARYIEAFSNDVAHQQFIDALSLEAVLANNRAQNDPDAATDGNRSRTRQRFLCRIKTLLRQPNMLPEYMNWMAQRILMGRAPTRQIYGIKVGSFVNFSEFHSVSRVISYEERMFFETFDFGEGAVIDIGANLGLVSLLASKRFPDRRVIAVEPAPSTYAALSANVALNSANIETLQFAISDVDGNLRFAAREDARDTAFVVTDRSFSGAFIEVAAHRLDTLVQRLSIKKIALLKIDTEGYETAVLRGGHGVLSAIRPRAIYFEVCPKLSRRAGFAASEPAQILTTAGYELFRFGEGQTLLSVVPLQAEDTVSENWLALLPEDACRLEGEVA